MFGIVLSTTATVAVQLADAPWLSVTVRMTWLSPSVYDPGGDWANVIVSPVSGSNEPSSMEASAVQLASADTVTLLHLATGGWLVTACLHLPALPALKMALILDFERSRF